MSYISFSSLFARERVADRLLLAPVDLRMADGFVAQEMVSGRLNIAGKAISIEGNNPFLASHLEPSFERELMSFGWLRHLRAADPDSSERAEHIALYLTSLWADAFGKPKPNVGWDVDVAADRLIAFLSHSPIILKHAEHDFYRLFLRLISEHMSYLRRQTPFIYQPDIRLKSRIAIAMGRLCVPSSNAHVKTVSDDLDIELEQQILRDGGHISRSPEKILDILANLLPLRQTYVNLGCALPKHLIPSMDKMFPALRFFRHSNGELALFHGTSFIPANYLLAVLQCDDTGGQLPNSMNDTQFVRLNHQDSVLIMDCGYPSPAGISNHMHASCLAFEFSSGAHRLIVNAGHTAFIAQQHKDFPRFTAAHSTLIVDDTSSNRMVNGGILGKIFNRGVSQVKIKDAAHPDMSGVVAMHNGYEAAMGLYHRREIVLSDDGEHLKGTDSVEFTAKKKKSGLLDHSIDVRFHVHPMVRIQKNANGSVMFELLKNEIWEFSCSEVEPVIEADIHFADVLGARSSEQIVLHFKSSEMTKINWDLKRISAPQDLASVEAGDGINNTIEGPETEIPTE